MTTISSKPLTGDTSIADWLADPVGGPILRDMLAQGGQSADVFRPVKRLAIKRLVKMSKGAFSQETLDALVRRAAAGDVPAGARSRAPADADGSTPARRTSRAACASGPSASTADASPARP